MKKIPRPMGQALLEFALVFPLILLVIVVFIDLGRIVYYYSALSNAVREGARFATVQQFPTSTDRDLAVWEKVATYAVGMPIVPGDVQTWCNRDTANTSNPCTQFVTVQADVEIEPMAVFLAQMLGSGNTFNITAESTMQMTPYGTYVE